MVRTVNVTIASGQTVSAAVNLERGTILSFQFPTMTGTTIALSECETSDGTFKPVGDELAALSISSPSGRAVHPGAMLMGMNWIKLTSGGAEGADRTIALQVADFVG